MKAIYLGLCVLGTVLPTPNSSHSFKDGLNAALSGAARATRIGGFFGMDVVVSSVVLWVFVRAGAQAGMRHLGSDRGDSRRGSLGLPLFLYLRERRLQLQSVSRR